MILPAADVSTNLANLFPQQLLTDPKTGESWVVHHGNFELLEAAIGDASLCNTYMQNQVHKAKKLPSEL